MMKVRYLHAFFALFLIFVSCSDSSTSPFTGDKASDEKQFVWNGLNYWYFWQSSVSDLSDTRFSNEEQFHDFLNSYPNGRSLFNSVLFSEDDFSWFVDDYVVHEQSRIGITKSFGMRFGLVRERENQPEVFGYVQYVVPGSPAESAGIVRGNLFNRINGTRLTEHNFQNLLANETYNLTLAKLEDGSIQETGETATVTSVELQEDPVHLAKVIETGGMKVGYLVLNAFRFNFHSQMNDAFGLFANEQVDELVIDFRYNSGGALITSAILAGMISGFDDSMDFAELRYNEKRSAQNFTFPFYDEVPVYNNSGQLQNRVAMNHLSMDKVYVLTGRNTASASETVINGLRPFIDVEIIGVQTLGKDEGSITLYDVPSANYSPSNDSDREKINPSHRRAMQPIVFKIFNSSGQDYPDGFHPDHTIDEIRFLENLPPLGDENEPLLQRALQIITGTEPLARMASDPLFWGEVLMDSSELDPFYDHMYLLPGDY